jgi:hypothetical protein
MVDLTPSGDQDDAGLILNSFDTIAWRECRRRAIPAASRRGEDQNADWGVARSSPNSFDRGERGCRRRAVPVANRPAEASAWPPRLGAHHFETSSVRSAPAQRSDRRAPRHFAPLRRVQWRFVSRNHARAWPRGRRGTRRIGYPLKPFWARERVVLLRKLGAIPGQQGDHGVLDEREESKRPRTSLSVRAFERNLTSSPVFSLSRSKV